MFISWPSSPARKLVMIMVMFILMLASQMRIANIKHERGNCKPKAIRMIGLISSPLFGASVMQ